MKEKIYNNIVLIYFCIVLLIMLFGGIVLTHTSLDTMVYTNVLFYAAIVGLFIYLFYKMNMNKFEIKDFFIIGFIIFDFISLYFAYDRYIALNGFIGRREGLLVLMAYYIFFLLASTLNSKSHIKKFICILSIHCFIQIIYGFLQVLGVENFLGIEIQFNYYHYAFCLVGNSNFSSTLMLLILGIWIGIYMFDDKLFNIKKIICLEVFLIGLILCGAMSGFVGFVMIILLLIAYIIYLKIFKKKIIFNYLIKICIIFVLFVWNIVFLSYYANNQYALDIFDLNTQTTQIADEGLKDENGTGRIYIWKIALKNAPRYLLTGIGIDQFMYINDGEYIKDPITGNIVDKAHNEYLQILLTEGIFKCIIYIIFLLWIFFKSVYSIIKMKKVDGVFFGLFLSFTGYAVQAFFNISVARVAPIFFIISGLLLSEIESAKKNIKE